MAEMAYVGRTERLCKAIVAEDLNDVEACLAEKGSDPNRRDYTGRTPLQLACMSSTPEIVQALLKRGARMIPRMADGKTALHLAASRGHVQIIQILITKSNENEEEEARKQDALKKHIELETEANSSVDRKDDRKEDESDEDDASHTSASYVKVEQEPPLVTYDTIEENDLEPDIYDVNAVAWDSRASPLHLAVLNGHTDVVKELISSFGADVLLPVKILNDYNRKPEAAILNLVLAFSLPPEKAREITRTLLELGASVAQADLRQKTALFYSIHDRRSDMLDMYFEHDMPAVKRAINHLAVSGSHWSPTFSSPLMEALRKRMPEMALKLLNAGSKPEIELSELVKAYKTANRDDNYLHGLEDRLSDAIRQPILLATSNDLPLIAIDLLERGVNPNTTFKSRYGFDGQSVLDSTRDNLERLRAFLGARPVSQQMHGQSNPMVFDGDDESYLAQFPADSYRRFIAKASLEDARKASRVAEERIEEEKRELRNLIGVDAKMEAVSNLIRDYEKLETRLLANGAKTFAEIHPEESRSNSVVSPQHRYPEIAKKTFKIEFKFDRPGLSDIHREGYLRL
jgi:ankyrin repeat protein